MVEVGKLSFVITLNLKGIKCKLLNSKFKSISVVLEGFIISIIVHIVSGYYFTHKLAEILLDFPPITIALLSSPAISPVIAIIYLAFRAKFFPKFSANREVLLYSLSGIIAAWLVIFIKILLLGKEISLAKEVLETPQPYNYLNLFLIILWGSLIEETLYRGYFFEILKQNWNSKMAFLFSTILFVIDHGIWWSFDIYLFFIFLYSVIFTLTYMKGGLIASILVHVFVNFYLFYLNM